MVYEYKDGVLTRTEQAVAGEKPIAEPVTETLAEGLSNFAFAYVQDPASPAGSNGSADASRPPKLVQVTLAWPAASVSGQFLVLVREPLAPAGQE